MRICFRPQLLKGLVTPTRLGTCFQKGKAKEYSSVSRRLNTRIFNRPMAASVLFGPSDIAIPSDAGLCQTWGEKSQTTYNLERREYMLLPTIEQVHGCVTTSEKIKPFWQLLWMPISTCKARTMLKLCWGGLTSEDICSSAALICFKWCEVANTIWWIYLVPEFLLWSYETLLAFDQRPM